MQVGTVLAIIGMGITIAMTFLHRAYPAIPRWIDLLGLFGGIAIFGTGCVFLVRNVASTYRVIIIRNSTDAANLQSWPFAIAIVAVIVIVILVAQYFTHIVTVPLIDIARPVKGSEVDLIATISGLVRPRDSFVQVFVLSGDNKWYPFQVNVEGALWSVQCQIGSETARSGTEYKLVAISGAKRITQAISTLPRGEARSRILTVRRK
jgi:hypothetical protein